jgi:hypothetical protein
MNRLYCFKAFVLLAMTLLPAASAVADYVVRELGKEDGEPSRFFVPYGFSSEAMGLVVGVAGGISGLPQEQNSFFTTALVSDEGAAAVYAFFNDYQISPIPRLFLDAAVGFGEFPQQRAYLDVGPSVNKPPAGSNDSSADDFFSTDGFSEWIEIDFKYVLDIGHGRYTPINTYTLSNGLLVGGASGGGVFNPFKSGRSYLQAKLFHQDRDYDDVDPSTALKTSGLGLSFKYDNTDFQVNPSTGNVLEIGVKHDPGTYESNSWTVGELEFSQYFKLTPGPKIEQSVIAIDFWTAHNFDDDLAPYYMGPTLGGLYRLRAYPIERFHDTSAIYYSAEYRVIPESDLLRSLSFLEFANLQWWSLAVFIEYGRVAPEWDLKELHESMKHDVGLSMRVMAAQNIARIDLVWSNEDTAAWLMYGHPF